VLRFFEEAMLESVGWIGGYIQIGQNGLEIQWPLVSSDEAYA
jgi:hypothetical protein